LREAALFAEGRLTSDRALAEIAGYLSRKDLPLNAALLKLIEVAGNRDAEVAALATALLNHIGKTAAVDRWRVNNVRRKSGIVVIAQ
jgi:hypothetical protein